MPPTDRTPSEPGPVRLGAASSYTTVNVHLSGVSLGSTLYPSQRRASVHVGDDVTLFFDLDDLSRVQWFLRDVREALSVAMTNPTESVAS